ncbi:MAG: NAD-dependent deacylase [Rhizobacter sp.]|nr:NAD-dependent deacylase [Rhizobacter sp.]
MNEPAPLREARALVQGAGTLAVLTGAGMSAESGIATFRDAQTGLWAKFDPAQLASPEGFRANPSLVWDWYAERRQGVQRAQPNAGHVALAQYEKAHRGRVTVVTQNVDDLHQRAGSTDVIRLHGDILQDHWLDACPRDPACDTEWASPTRPPRCEQCGNLVRPGVVWFGEMLPAEALSRAELLAQSCDVMLVIGTSGAVYPAAGLAHTARRAGAKVIILNPEPSEIDDDAHLLLRGTAARILPALLQTE